MQIGLDLLLSPTIEDDSIETAMGDENRLGATKDDRNVQDAATRQAVVALSSEEEEEERKRNESDRGRFLGSSQPTHKA